MHHPWPSARPTLQVAWFAAALLPALLSAQPAATAEAVVELPKLTITDTTPLPDLESWRHTRLGDFEVLSNAGDRETRKLLADFAKFQQAVRLVWAAPTKPLAASSLILCGRGNKFDAFRPDGGNVNGPLVPSLFLRNREQIALVVDLQLDQVSVTDPVALVNANASAIEYQVDHYRQLYREYVHYLLSQREVRPPAWLEEGLAQIVMDIDLSGQTLVLGKIESHRGEAIGGSPLDAEDTDATVADAVVGEQPFNAVLAHRRLLPLEKFFAITHDDPEALNPLGNSLWAKQAYCFVHYCLFGEDLRYKDALVTFVGRLTREPPTEALFKECFKVSYADMQKKLDQYIIYTKHKYQRYDLNKTNQVDPASIELTDATPAQIALIKEDALRLAGHPAAAFNEYRAAYQRGARDADLLGGLGATVNDQVMARKFTDEAVRTGADRPSILVAQARARLTEFKGDPGPDGKLTKVQVAAVLTPLFNARRLPPALPELYETIADTWESSSVPARPEHLAVLDEGVRQFPRDSALLEHTSRLYAGAGDAAKAASIARLGLRFASDDVTRTRLQQLLATLPDPH